MGNMMNHQNFGYLFSFEMNSTSRASRGHLQKTQTTNHAYIWKDNWDMLGVVPPSCKKPFWRKVPAHEFWGFCLQVRNILKTIRLFLRKIRVFLRKNHLFLHPSFYFSIRPFLCHLDLSRKKRNILRKIRVLLKNIWVQPDLRESPL